jgi:hypothetical protein
MAMKANIEVKDRREADAIRSGLEDPFLRALVIVTGVLNELSSDRTRKRVLEYMRDKLDEEYGGDTEPALAQSAGDGKAS